MNATRLIFLAAVLLPGAVIATTPEAVPLTRYQPLIERSPFSPATAPAAAPAASFAKDYYITGLASVGDKAFVSVSSRDQQTRFSLLEGESYDGITFTRVEWAPGVGKSRAVLTKGGTTDVVGFDEVAMRAAPAPTAAAPAPNPATQQAQQGGWGRDRGDRRGRGRGRDRGEWGSPEQRQYMREQRRAWFRAMHGQQNGQQNAQQGNQRQGGQNNQHQRQQPINPHF